MGRWGDGDFWEATSSVPGIQIWSRVVVEIMGCSPLIRYVLEVELSGFLINWIGWVMERGGLGVIPAFGFLTWATGECHKLW